MYSSRWLEDTRQQCVSHVTLTTYIKELRKIVTAVIARIMSKPVLPITRLQDFQLIVKAVISSPIPIGVTPNLIISNFSLWLDVIPVRNVRVVIKVESIEVHRAIVMDVIDPILNLQKIRIIGKRVFPQLVNHVTK
jgi:hypothetical protein